jgi:predicted O-methyltransferase YrrM
MSDPYASHLGLLTRIGPGITQVLELGAGQYSTPLFLNRAVYPDLERLVTIEPVIEWALTLKPEPRLTIVITSMPPVEILSDLITVPFDLFFVDNHPAEEREAVIKWLAHTGGVRVVIHDFEETRYQRAAMNFYHTEIDKTATPWTALCSND